MNSDHYLVDVIGFNEVERQMLASIFALAARRDPGFAQFEPGTPGRTPDLYLVDADRTEAFQEFRSLHKRARLPSVLIGTNAHGTDFPLLPRPLQWARLLQALDDALNAGEDIAPAAAVQAVLARTQPGGVPAGMTQPGLARSNAPHSVPPSPGWRLDGIST